jgi:hypothetical protein
VNKPTITPIKPLVLQTAIAPGGYITSETPALHVFETVIDVRARAMHHDLRLLHSLVPFLALMDEVVAADDSNVSPNATAYKLKEALAAYREARS